MLLRDGVEYGFRECVREQLHRHPSSQPEDVLKQCFQAARGPAHILGKIDKARKDFDAEYAFVTPRPGEPLYEVISPDFMRVNLGAWKATGMPSEWLFRLFTASAREFSDADAVLKMYFATAEAELDEPKRKRFAELRKDAVSSPHHSSAYRAAEKPSYRVVSIRFLNVFTVLLKAAALPERDGVRVIVIDGRSASGKTTLAKQLSLILDADVVHMDDFFYRLNCVRPSATPSLEEMSTTNDSCVRSCLTSKTRRPLPTGSSTAQRWNMAVERRSAPTNGGSSRERTLCTRNSGFTLT